jgi:hypothetical protein
MRAVEFNQALGGMEGAQLPPLPPAPPNPAHTVPLPCSAQHQHQKGDISNSLTMGTFLNSFDTKSSGYSLRAPSTPYNYSFYPRNLEGL